MPCSKFRKSNLNPDTHTIFEVAALSARVGFSSQDVGRNRAVPHGESTIVDLLRVVILAPQHKGGRPPRPLLSLYFRIRSAFTAAR